MAEHPGRGSEEPEVERQAEHAGGGPPAAEHPAAQQPPAEHPGGRELTSEEIARAIEDYVKNDTRMKGGQFTVYDLAARKALALSLEMIHRDKLAKISDDTCFACADFRSVEGKLYDLDMFVKETDEGPRVVELGIHKEEGSPRYQWVEESGIWRKR